tara:strand:+ start:460 stop:660 length:201 start_codon:yes stop_codon:yes gene_type:complete
LVDFFEEKELISNFRDVQDDELEKFSLRKPVLTSFLEKTETCNFSQTTFFETLRDYLIKKKFEYIF